MSAKHERVAKSPKRTAYSEALWWTFFIITLFTAFILCWICLFGTRGIAAQTRQPPASNSNAQQAPPSTPSAPATPDPVSSADTRVGKSGESKPESLETRVTKVEAQLGEASKRIDETGSHASQILNVIGMLVGFISVVVAIGLWQSKQYIDRVVEHYKTEMKNFIKEETEKQLGESKTAISDEFKKSTEQTMEQLNSRGRAILNNLNEKQLEAQSGLHSISESNLEINQRVGILSIERLPRIIDKALEVARQKNLLTEEEQLTWKKEVDFSVYTQKEILRALVQLESENADEVIAGSHNIAALQDRTCLPYLKLALSRWSKREDQRVVQQISTTYEKLLATQEQ